jgi:hypothetical protein
MRVEFEEKKNLLFKEQDELVVSGVAVCQLLLWSV